jgi:hypothetical protein
MDKRIFIWIQSRNSSDADCGRRVGSTFITIIGREKITKKLIHEKNAVCLYFLPMLHNFTQKQG